MYSITFAWDVRGWAERVWIDGGDREDACTCGAEAWRFGYAEVEDINEGYEERSMSGSV